MSGLEIDRCPSPSISELFAHALRDRGSKPLRGIWPPGNPPNWKVLREYKDLAKLEDYVSKFVTETVGVK